MSNLFLVAAQGSEGAVLGHEQQAGSGVVVLPLQHALDGLFQRSLAQWRRTRAVVSSLHQRAFPPTQTSQDPNNRHSLILILLLLYYILLIHYYTYVK